MSKTRFVMNYQGHKIDEITEVCELPVLWVTATDGSRPTFLAYDPADPDRNYPKALMAILKYIDSLTPNQSTMTTTTKKDAEPKAPAPFSAPVLLHVSVNDIVADPNQPRKYFDETTDKELLDSIKQQGILQPLLLRYITDSAAYKHKGKEKYLVVCGERRFRAAKVVGKGDPAYMVPAIIRQMNDDEAMEAQIVENLQRKDVHPMEEALAFEHLTKRGLTQEQIGQRVGKGDRFVRARLTLCSLTKAWQELFLGHRIDLELATKISRFTSATQENILKDQKISKTELADKSFKIVVKDFSAYKGDLQTACFDLADPTLNPKMGACIGCTFNTASALLFAEEGPIPRCTNLGCFGIKVEAGFKKRMNEAKENPNVILVKMGYRAQDGKDIKALKEQGLTVIGSEDFNDETPQYPGTFDEWKTKSLENEYGGADYEPLDTEMENRDRYEQEIADYQKDLKKVADQIKAGSLKQALVVQGDDDDPKGKMIVIRVLSKSGRSGSSSGSSGDGTPRMTPAAKVAAGKATMADLDSEIERLKEDIDKTKDKILDNGHIALVTEYKANPATIDKINRPLTVVEKNCLMFFLLDQIGGVDDLMFWASDEEMGAEEKFAKALGVSGKGGKKKKSVGYYNKESNGMDADDVKDQVNVWAFLSSLTDGQLALIFRRVIADKYGQVTQMIPSGYNKGKAWIMRKMIETWDGTGPGLINIASIEAEVKEKGDKRIQRANDRIKELRSQKTDMEKTKAAKAAGKGATAKPAAKSAPASTKKAKAK